MHILINIGSLMGTSSLFSHPVSKSSCCVPLLFQFDSPTTNYSVGFTQNLFLLPVPFCTKLAVSLFPALRETRPLRTFDFGKRAIKVRKCDGKVTFTIPFQDIYPFIKGNLAQHQERSCKGGLSITLTIP